MFAVVADNQCQYLKLFINLINSFLPERMDAIIQLAKFSTFRKVVLMFNIFNAVQMVGLAIFTGIVFINKVFFLILIKIYQN